MIARKHLIRVTLDIECYDDLYLEDLDWQDLLELEGDESVDVNIQQLADAYQCAVPRLEHFKYSFVTVVELHTKCPIRIRDGVLLFLWVENVTYFPTNSFHK